MLILHQGANIYWEKSYREFQSKKDIKPLKNTNKWNKVTIHTTEIGNINSFLSKAKNMTSKQGLILTRITIN